LQQWTGSIYTWLTHPLLDPQKSGRVIMDHLMKLITTALEWSYAQGEKDVNPRHDDKDRKEGPPKAPYPK
jgi:hypothetical protein